MTSMTKPELQCELDAANNLNEKIVADMRTMRSDMDELESRNKQLQQIVNGLNKRHEDLLQMSISMSMAIKVLARDNPA